MTKSSDTAEKQRVIYACLSRLANWSCNSLKTAGVVHVVQLATVVSTVSAIRKRPTYAADEAF